MTKYDLIDGLKFVNEHNLSVKEVTIIIPFFTGNHTLSDILELTNVKGPSAYRIIRKLLDKNILVIDDRDIDLNRKYQLKKELF